MMKHLTLAFILLLNSALPQLASAQNTGEWIRVTSAEEQFTVQLPSRPEVKKQRNKFAPLDVDGQRYSVVDNGSAFTLWSLKNTAYTREQGGDSESYLDDCAELVWESLLAPERQKLPEMVAARARMTYQRAVEAAFPGREYSISLGKQSGVTRLYVAGERIFVLMVLNTAMDDASAQRFFRSFVIREGVKTTPPPAAGDRPGSGQGMGEGYGPGRGGNAEDPRASVANDSAASGPVDYNRVFNTREVSQRARVLSRPEPMYTESARKFGVTGTVIVRAVISNAGDVTNIKVVKGLPHGLSKTAREAARLIKFSPALKDGRAVAQYIQIEYNFNLY